MKQSEKQKAYLVLQDGTIFKGTAIGKIGTATGEICFNTGMTGYQEIFTDPSYYGQLMLMTNVHIGNYGVHKDEIESDKIKIAGLIVKSFSEMYSRKAGDASLNDYLIAQNCTGIADIDTRALVRHISENGAMNGIISSDDLDVESLKAKLQKVPSMEGLELSSFVSTRQAYTVGNADAPFRVSVLDFGVKKNILRCLVERGCYVKVFPHNAHFNELKAAEPSGYFLSNGPGDPAAMTYAFDTVKAILNSGKPVFGICLGHQLIAESLGVRTFKMHNGHRGINHPVKNLLTGKCEVTSQNHGFAVNTEDLKKNDDIEITHINLNDDTLEGMRLKSKKVFSVQYHPEASPGPHDSRYLFDSFIENMRSAKNEKKPASIS
jgi:carbamoyl-phosphate synthase small subunit